MSAPVDKTITVLIADDQILFAESLRYVIKGISELIDIVGIAPDGEAAVALTREYHPDVILMDVRMPKMDGVEATKLIHLLHPDVKIVMLTTFDDDEYVHFAVKYGAVGYLLKNIRPEALVASIRAVMAGASIFAEDISPKVIRDASEHVGEFERIIAGLTRREKEVLNLAMQMLNNRQIAERTFLSEQSIRNYMSSLYHAFGVNERMELIQKLRTFSMMT